MHRVIAPSGLARSKKPACAVGRSSTINSWTHCGRCDNKYGKSYWLRPTGTKCGNCYAGFHSSARFGRRSSLPSSRRRIAFEPSDSCGLTVGLGSRRTAVLTIVVPMATATLEEEDFGSGVESQSQSRSEELVQECCNRGRCQGRSVPGVLRCANRQGIKPEMAGLTLARKIAAITLTVWKKGVRFDAKYLNPQTA